MNRLPSFLLICFTLLSCGPNKNSPEYVAKKYLEALRDKNWDEAKKYTTKDCYDKIDMLRILGTQYGLIEIKDIKCSIDKDQATCFFCCTDQPDVNCVNLVNEDNKWLVSLRKTISCRDKVLFDSLYSPEQTDTIPMNTKKLPTDFEYLPDMYADTYFPKFLVDKLKAIIKKVVVFIEEGNHTKEEVQAELDKMTIAINDMQEEFYENNSEIETATRESIAETVERILAFFQIDIDTEEAIRERDW